MTDASGLDGEATEADATGSGQDAAAMGVVGAENADVSRESTLGTKGIGTVPPRITCRNFSAPYNRNPRSHVVLD